MVTTVLLPAIRRSTPPAEQYPLFERIEHRFAAQARWSTQLVGASGHGHVVADRQLGAADQHRLAAPDAGGVRGVHPDAVCAGALADSSSAGRLGATEPALAMRRLQRMHWLLLAISLAAVGFGVVGAHGGWQLG